MSDQITNKCISCELTYNYINNKMCIMCNICNNPVTTDVFSFVIGKSNLNQIEIIKKTKDFISKNNKVPLPTDIDNEVNIISINPCIFLQIIKIMDNLDNKEDRNIFENFKIFFTDDLNIKQIKTFRIFDKVIKNKSNINYNYKFNKKEAKIYNKYYNDYINKSKDILNSLFNQSIDTSSL